MVTGCGKDDEIISLQVAHRGMPRQIIGCRAKKSTSLLNDVQVLRRGHFPDRRFQGRLNQNNLPLVAQFLFAGLDLFLLGRMLTN